MVPAWVLLKRMIYIEHDASASGGASEAGEESMGSASAGGAGEESMGSASAGGAGEESMGGARAGESGKKWIGGSGKKSMGAGGAAEESMGGATSADPGKKSMGGAGASAGGSGKKSMGGIVSPRPDITEAILQYLQSLKPDARFANPPELSALRLLRPTESIPQLCGGITSAFIASADKDLVALYAGPYRAGTDLKGGYLIYDASKNSLSTIPKPPYDYSRDELGLGTVVVALAGEEDTYRLCELTKIRGSDPPEAALCTWRPSSQEWMVESAGFPTELSPPNYFFVADMCFSYQGSILCWVDLFKGMVVCHLKLQTGGRPEFSFISLPRECVTCDRSGQGSERPRLAEESRSIACVGGSIKFVTMDGYGQRPGHELSLTIWTLSMDLSGWNWNKGKEYCVRDIWASEAYISLGLPYNICPSFPVLSMDEDDVVYLVVTRWNRAVDGKVEYSGQYLLCVDMENNKVSLRSTNTEQLRSQLFATECSSFPHCLEDHQGKFKARKVAASGKRVML